MDHQEDSTSCTFFSDIKEGEGRQCFSLLLGMGVEWAHFV